KLSTSPMPPLAKFAAAPFGIVERYAEGPDSQPMLPVTLRHVEHKLEVSALQVSRLQPETDAEIIDWYRRVQRYDGFAVSRAMAAKDLRQPLPPPIDEDSKTSVQPRMLSLLSGESSVQTLQLPTPNEGKES